MGVGSYAGIVSALVDRAWRLVCPPSRAVRFSETTERQRIGVEPMARAEVLEWGIKDRIFRRRELCAAVAPAWQSSLAHAACRLSLPGPTAAPFVHLRFVSGVLWFSRAITRFPGPGPGRAYPRGSYAGIVSALVDRAWRLVCPPSRAVRFSETTERQRIGVEPMARAEVLEWGIKDRIFRRRELCAAVAPAWQSSLAHAACRLSLPGKWNASWRRRSCCRPVPSWRT